MNKRIFIALGTVATLLISGSASAETHDNFNVGAMVGVGIPSLVSGQLVLKVKDVVGLTGEYGFTPDFTVSNVSVHQNMMDLGLRLYPFRGSFFVSGGLGTQNVYLSDPSDYNTSLKLKTTFFDPRLGFLKKFDFGLALGMDFGVEIPLSGGIEDLTTLAPVDKTTPTVKKFGDKAASVPVPILNLFRLGYVW